MRKIEVQKILQKIYVDLFEQLGANSLDVFLCGGASTKKSISSRDMIRKKLEQEKAVRILYPEDLFIEMMNKQPSYNLLELERLLADNVDFICIVCESVGSYVELGAFCSINEISEKVVALVQTKYKNDESFIMLGPIKGILQKDKKRVLYYNNTIDETVEELNKFFRVKMHSKRKKRYSINNITGLHYFIMIVLLLFEKIKVSELIIMLKEFSKEKAFEKEIEQILLPSIKLLYKERLIEKTKLKDNDYYMLTDKGKKVCYNILLAARISNLDFVIDKFKLNCIQATYY